MADSFTVNWKGKLKYLWEKLYATSVAYFSSASFTGDVTVEGDFFLEGGRIMFPATQNPSAGVNTLDDYEEGTFTPTLGDGTNNYTLSAAEGAYTKIGDRVFWEATIIWTSKGSAGASQLRMGGLPFTTNNTGTPRFPAVIGRQSGFSVAAHGYATGGVTVVFINEASTGNAINANAPSASGELFIGGHYRV